jgi:hypothetical protein
VKKTLLTILTTLLLLVSATASRAQAATHVLFTWGNPNTGPFCSVSVPVSCIKYLSLTDLTGLYTISATLNPTLTTYSYYPPAGQAQLIFGYSHTFNLEYIAVDPLGNLVSGPAATTTVVDSLLLAPTGFSAVLSSSTIAGQVKAPALHGAKR